MKSHTDYSVVQRATEWNANLPTRPLVPLSCPSVCLLTSSLDFNQTSLWWSSIEGWGGLAGWSVQISNPTPLCLQLWRYFRLMLRMILRCATGSSTPSLTTRQRLRGNTSVFPRISSLMCDRGWSSRGGVSRGVFLFSFKSSHKPLFFFVCKNMKGLLQTEPNNFWSRLTSSPVIFPGCLTYWRQTFTVHVCGHKEVRLGQRKKYVNLGHSCNYCIEVRIKKRTDRGWPWF